jgi:hypothetical protein
METAALSVLKWKPLITVDFLLNVMPAPSCLGDGYVRFDSFVKGTCAETRGSAAVSDAADWGAAVKQPQQHSAQKDHYEFKSKILPNYFDIAESDIWRKKLGMQRLLGEVVELSFDAGAGSWRF